MDHTCGQPNGACAPSLITNPLMGSVAKASGFPPLGAHGVSPRRPKLWLIDIIPVKKTYLAFFLV